MKNDECLLFNKEKINRTFMNSKKNHYPITVKRNCDSPLISYMESFQVILTATAWRDNSLLLKGRLTLSTCDLENHKIEIKESDNIIPGFGSGNSKIAYHNLQSNRSPIQHSIVLY